jgi:hypothetical protein
MGSVHPDIGSSSEQEKQNAIKMIAADKVINLYIALVLDKDATYETGLE